MSAFSYETSQPEKISRSGGDDRQYDPNRAVHVELCGERLRHTPIGRMFVARCMIHCLSLLRLTGRAIGGFVIVHYVYEILVVLRFVSNEDRSAVRRARVFLLRRGAVVVFRVSCFPSTTTRFWLVTIPPYSPHSVELAVAVVLVCRFFVNCAEKVLVCCAVFSPSLSFLFRVRR